MPKQKKQVVEKPKPSGRPTTFKEEYIEQAYKLALLGLTDEEMASYFEVTVRSFYKWKQKYPRLIQALKDGKDNADQKVAQSLYKRALGYEDTDTKFATFEGKITDQVEYTRRFPPDVTACIFWLKNRQRSKWQEKIEQQHSGEATFKLNYSIEDDKE